MAWVTILYPPPPHQGIPRQSSGFSKSATFNGLLLTQDLKSPLGEGGGWLGAPSCTPPPPHQGILLFASFPLVN